MGRSTTKAYDSNVSKEAVEQQKEKFLRFLLPFRVKQDMVVAMCLCAYKSESNRKMGTWNKILHQQPCSEIYLGFSELDTDQ